MRNEMIYRIVPELAGPRYTRSFWTCFLYKPLFLAIPIVVLLLYPAVMVAAAFIGFLNPSRLHHLEALAEFMFNKERYLFTAAIALPFGLLLSPIIEVIHRWHVRRQWLEECARSAAATSEKANSIWYSLPSKLEVLQSAIDQAEHQLDRAEQRYEDRAFGPFWDTVEGTARTLAFYSSSVKELRQSVELYRKLLEGRTHNFPFLSVEEASALPNPEQTVLRFEELIEKAQKDFEFAVIWEHYKTREVLVAGFRNLADAIYYLTVALRSEIVDLRRSMISVSVQILNEQSQMRSTLQREARKWEELRNRLSN
jgi:hypothetical protein